VRRIFKDGEMEIYVEYRRFAFAGRGGVTLSIPSVGGLRLTMTLDDAESLGDALIGCVRAAEEK
jgi:hypothetical protein